MQSLLSENEVRERIEAAMIEAARFRRRLESPLPEEDRRVVRRQLEELENEIAAMRRRLVA